MDRVSKKVAQTSNVPTMPIQRSQATGNVLDSTLGTIDVFKANLAKVLAWAKNKMDQDKLLAKEIKEVDRLKLRPLLVAPTFADWKNDIRENISAASGRLRETWEWMLEIDRVKDPLMLLDHGCSKNGSFEQLDGKLQAALTSILNGNEDLRRSMRDKKLAFQAANGCAPMLMSGRMTMWYVYQYYKVRQLDTYILDIDKVYNIRTKGNHLRGFQGY